MCIRDRAMGSLEAIKAAGSDCVVVGTDGTSEAIASIQEGELDATVDFSPKVDVYKRQVRSMA